MRGNPIGKTGSLISKHSCSIEVSETEVETDLEIEMPSQPASIQTNLSGHFPFVSEHYGALFENHHPAWEESIEIPEGEVASQTDSSVTPPPVLSRDEEIRDQFRKQVKQAAASSVPSPNLKIMECEIIAEDSNSPPSRPVFPADQEMKEKQEAMKNAIWAVAEKTSRAKELREERKRSEETNNRKRSEFKRMVFASRRR